MNYGIALFPGQGAQHTGMGKDLYENSASARSVYECASDIAGIDVANLSFEGTQDELNRTVNSQLTIFTHSMAALAALREKGAEFSACAGFSLGEYTAMAAAGMVSLEDGVRIVCKRGQVMQAAADSMDSGMAAVLGLDDAAVESACAAVKDGVVIPVNYNCPGQLVIAGERAALDAAAENCKTAGAKRVVPLAVSGAFHTPLLAHAAEELYAFLQNIQFNAPTLPIYTNLTGKLLDTNDLPEHLKQHMCSPVRWETLIRSAMADHITCGCEIGPGKTLIGFARKIDKTFTVKPAATYENVENVVQQ